MTYCEDVGYFVYAVISVRKTCMISRRAFEDITPVSMALCTLPEKQSRSGMLKVGCQWDEVEEEVVDEEEEEEEEVDIESTG